MPGRKAQIAIEYIIITSLILIVATMVFAYSYVSNNQSINQPVHYASHVLKHSGKNREKKRQ